MSALESHPCRQLCNWRPVAGTHPKLFRCLGCRSEWNHQEQWTPAQANGEVPPAVVAERRRIDPTWGSK